MIQEEKMLTISNLVVTNGSKKLTLEHIAWNDWPDRGVPNNFLAPFRLLQRIKNQIHVVIHCSAGIFTNHFHQQNFFEMKYLPKKQFARKYPTVRIIVENSKISIYKFLTNFC